MSARAVMLLGVLLAGCKPFQHQPLPPDPRYGTVVDESSPLRPLSTFFEHHGDSVTMTAFEPAGYDLDLQSKGALWRVKRIALADFSVTELPPPPITPTASFRMAVPLGTADVDVVWSTSELAVRNGDTWTARPAPLASRTGFIRFMTVAGPDALTLQTDTGVWVLRGERWEQLAPDLGARTLLVAREGDRVRLVAGAPDDPTTKLPSGSTITALVSASTGERLSDEVLNDRFGGLHMTGLHGSTEDFELFVAERGTAPGYVRRVRYVGGALVRQGRWRQEYLDGYAAPLPTPGPPKMLFADEQAFAIKQGWAPCGCDIKQDETCTCVDRPVVRALLPAPDGVHAIAVVLAAEEARAHVYLRELDLSTPADPQSLVNPGSCFPACEAPLVCREDAASSFSCGTAPALVGGPVPDPLPVTLTGHLAVPPGVEPSTVDVTSPADFDVLQYGPEVRIAVPAGVAGTVAFDSVAAGLHATAPYPASTAGSVVDLGTITF